MSRAKLESFPRVTLLNGPSPVERWNRLSADVRLDPAGFGIGFRDSWMQAIEDFEASCGKPYPIPAGASDHRLGGHGFVGWALEVEDQEAELGGQFDYVVVCSVTGSTQAGVIAGFAHSNRADRVLGIDASATVDKTWDQIARIEGVITDPVHEGKSIAALIDLVREGVFLAGSRVLYAHLGGQPALNAYTDVFADGR